VSAFLTSVSGPGLTLRRIRGFLGRSDQMVKLRGINVYPTAIGAYLALEPAVTGEYVCRVERRGSRDEMTVVVEARPGAERRGLETELRALLRQKLGVAVDVELVGPGATAPLTELEGRQKPIRLIDRQR
jgi:phenylacetate-CoA ligase